MSSPFNICRLNSPSNALLQITLLLSLIFHKHFTKYTLGTSVGLSARSPEELCWLLSSLRALMHVLLKHTPPFWGVGIFHLFVCLFGF